MKEKASKLYKCLFKMEIFTGKNSPEVDKMIENPINVLLSDPNIKRLRYQIHKQVDDLMDMAERTYEE